MANVAEQRSPTEGCNTNSVDAFLRGYFVRRMRVNSEDFVAVMLRNVARVDAQICDAGLNDDVAGFIPRGVVKGARG